MTTPTADPRFPTPLNKKGAPYPLQPCTGCGRLTNHQFLADGWEHSRAYCVACFDADRMPAGTWR